MHWVNGSPIYPSLHKHDTVWSEHKQTALIPHTLLKEHGSTHFLLMQASFVGQSEFITHSGLHSIFGSPKNSGGQVHSALSPISWQIAFIPHCTLLQGLIDFWSSGGRQQIKGLPMSPSSQLHTGRWDSTWHLAFKPQAPGHGSTQVYPIQALLNLHSSSTSHSREWQPSCP